MSSSLAEPARWRDPLGLAARLAAGGIWLAAGIAKALDFDAFHVQLEGYDVLPHATVSWAEPIAGGRILSLSMIGSRRGTVNW